MPARNLLVLCLAGVFSLACYHRASHNRYAAAIAEAMGQIDTNFVQPIDRRSLFEGSLQGMVRELDEYSSYVGPEEYDKLLEDLDQEFGGVGIIVDVDPDTKRLMVLSPFVGTPAYDAGIRAGDLIMEIEGQDTAEMSANDTVSLIRGKPGTPVNLTILPFGKEETRQVTLVRAIIPVESVLGDRRLGDGRWEYFLEEHPHIGYIRLSSFGDNSTSDLKTALEGIVGSVDGLILDLRGNPGGLLEAAVSTSDLFLDDGVIVSIKGRQQVLLQEYYAEQGKVVPEDLPLVVMVDHYSASASEIVAACLQDYGRAVVVGERSWGKGTVQSVYELEGGRSALRLTTATYWRPSGKNIHRLASSKEADDWGVTPDEGFEIKYGKEELLQVLRARRQRDVVMTRSGNTSLSPEDESSDQVAEDESNQAADSESETDADAPDVIPAENQPPVVDLQLQKAIEYINSRLAANQAKAA